MDYLKLDTLKSSQQYYILEKKWKNYRILKKKCENSRMLCPVKVFHFVCVFISESNRNTLQICMAHKICHSFIPLKKYLKMFSI